MGVFPAVPGIAVPGQAAPGVPRSAAFPPPPPPPLVSPGWKAAQAGLPGAPAAVNHSAQIGQFLAAHGITPVYAGTAILTPLPNSSAVNWVNLGTYDVDQPFTMPAGKTAIGRLTLPLSPAGSGADVTVSLYTDSAGAPGTLITSTRVAASWLAQLAAPGGLGSGGPLATAASNGRALTAGTNHVWTQPAVSLNGSGNYACPVSSGNYTILLGGYDSVALSAIPTVATIAWLGGQAISGPTPQPSLPQGAWAACAGVTSSSVFFAGGVNPSGAITASVWSASWDPNTGTVGSWTAQQALPTVLCNAGMATWGDFVYIVGGDTADTNATSVPTVLGATATNGQISSWATCPPLPQALNGVYVAAVSGWLIAAGGKNTAGTDQQACYYSPIRPDGTLGGWRAGPPLAQQAYSFSPGWNLAVTADAMAIISGTTSLTGGNSHVDQILTVTADGPAPAWQAQTTYSIGEYQVGMFADGNPGEYQTFNLHLTSYDAVPLVPVPLVSVPLPASGLTAGAAYHLVLHQNGGDLNDCTQAALMQSAYPTAASTRPSAGGPWTPLGSTYSVLASVYGQTAGGPVLHTWEDSGARITSLAYASASGQLTGVCEATAFADGTLLPAVTQITYSGAVPAGTLQLA